MSTVFAHVGQCGSSVGEEFWRSITHRAVQPIGSGPRTQSQSNNSSSASIKSENSKSNNKSLPSTSSSTSYQLNSSFFHFDGFSRAVLIDSEPKVIQSIRKLSLNQVIHQLQLSNNKFTKQNSSNNSIHRFTSEISMESLNSSIFRNKNIYFDQFGRGNNWAFGFYGRKQRREGGGGGNSMEMESHNDIQKNNHYRNSSSILKQSNEDRNNELNNNNNNNMNNNKSNTKNNKSTTNNNNNNNNSLTLNSTRKPFISSVNSSNSSSSHSVLFPSESSQSLSSLAIESLRHEIERCDNWSGILLFHSCSGGTGSGLGSRLLESMRNEFGNKFYLSTITITPFLIGETPLQHYNSLFTLSYCQEYCDSIITMSNEYIMKFLQLQYQAKRLKLNNNNNNNNNNNSQDIDSTPSIPFNILNQYISDCVLDIIAPIRSLKNPLDSDNIFNNINNNINDNNNNISNCKSILNSSSSNSFTAHRYPNFSLAELCTSVTPQSQYKFAEIWSTGRFLPNQSLLHKNSSSSSSASWNSYIDFLYRYIPRGESPSTTSSNSSSASSPFFADTLSYAAFCRGLDEFPISSTELSRINTKFDQLFSPVSWNPFPRDLILSPFAPYYSTQDSPIIPMQRSLSVCSNRGLSSPSSGINYLNHIYDRSLKMFSAGAYLHWYQQYQCEREDFQLAFYQVKNILNDYKSAVRKD